MSDPLTGTGAVLGAACWAQSCTVSLLIQISAWCLERLVVRCFTSRQLQTLRVLARLHIF